MIKKIIQCFKPKNNIMTQEEKELLLIDLSGRLPYKVKCSTPYGIEVLGSIDMEHVELTFEGPDDNYYALDKNIQPYLRSLSSMTESEREELKILCDKDLSEFAGHLMKGHGLSRDGLYMFDKLRQLDWLNKHHFDFRGLIDKGLAIEIDNETYEKIYGKI